MKQKLRADNTLADHLTSMAEAADKALEELTQIHHHYLPKCTGGCPYDEIAGNLRKEVEKAREAISTQTSLSLTACTFMRSKDANAESGVMINDNQLIIDMNGVPVPDVYNYWTRPERGRMVVHP